MEVRQGTKALGQRGLTLIELMIVLVIFGVVLTIGVPTFQQTIKNNRMSAEISALRATLANARSEAMAVRAPVIVCESSNGTSCSSSNEFTDGYIAFVDTDDDDVLDSDERIVLALQLDVPDSFSIEFTDPSGTVEGEVRFSSRGDTLDSTGTFTFCDDRGATYAGALVLNPSGSARGAIDSDSPTDDIVNDVSGANVSC